jgi:hypothetical protein
MRSLRKCVFVAVGAIALAVGPAGAQSDEHPPAYELKLVYLFDGPETEFIFVVGNSGFRTVESLRRFLASRPAGTTLRWNPGCVRLGGEPLLSSETEMELFVAFCREHGIDFVLVPSG